jgi:hypothetical protein
MTMGREVPPTWRSGVALGCVERPRTYGGSDRSEHDESTDVAELRTSGEATTTTKDGPEVAAGTTNRGTSAGGAMGGRERAPRSLRSGRGPRAAS